MANTRITRGKITDFIFDKFPLARKRRLSDEASLLDSGIVDSIGILEIVAFLEKEFAVRIDDDDLVSENFDTIAKISSFVMRKLDSRQTETEVVQGNVVTQGGS